VADDTNRGPDAYMAMRNRIGRDSVSSLAVAVQMWPTPTARDASRGAGWDGPGRPLSETVGGTLNPTWVAWLQGFPLDWMEVD
jgi:hypothetical protein